MYIDSLRDGWFRRLRTDERPLLLEHWGRLPDDCVRRRFLRPMRTADFKAHADAVFGTGAEALGWFRDGVLRGVGELFKGGTTAEAAFTVEPDFRRNGIGRALLQHVARRARILGCQTLVVMTTRDNAPMLRIALHEGATLEHDGLDVTGTIALDPATFATLFLDRQEEDASAVSEVATRMARMARAWWPGSALRR
ncbi:MAG: GNAT family N-acetyltransferase [Paracoccaceae bacterium]